MKSPFTRLTGKNSSVSSVNRKPDIPCFIGPRPPSKTTALTLPLVSIERAAEVSGLEVKHLRKLYRDGRISGFRVGKELFFSDSAIRAEIALLYRLVEVSKGGSNILAEIDFQSRDTAA